MRDVLSIIGIMIIIIGLGLMCGNAVVSAVNLYKTSPKLFWDVMITMVPIVMIVVGIAIVSMMSNTR